MKSISRPTRHPNTYLSLLLHIQPNRNSLILAKNDNASNYFMYHNKDKYLLGNEEQNIKEDQKNLIYKNLDNKSVKNMLLKYTPQDRLFASELFVIFFKRGLV